MLQYSATTLAYFAYNLSDLDNYLIDFANQLVVLINDKRVLVHFTP